ncbi:MAG: helix-turn-helix domain-containing protein [Candidatus Nanopelagicales bacterium]
MARDLLDLLWHDHASAPTRGARGPRPRVSTSRAVRAAVELADAEGIHGVTARRLAADLGVSPMSIYTYVGSQDDLHVLMADAVNGAMPRPAFGRRRLAARLRVVAEANLALHVDHPWLVDVADQRVSLGPGTIAKYDHELAAFDGTGLGDVEADAALTFVLDFARAAAWTRRADERAAGLADEWAQWAPRLEAYLGDDHPRARRVGAAAGEAMDAAYSPDHAWTFGLDRVVAAIEDLVQSTTATRPS